MRWKARIKVRRTKNDPLSAGQLQLQAHKLAQDLAPYHDERQYDGLYDGFIAGVAYAIRVITSGKAAVTIREGKK